MIDYMGLSTLNQLLRPENLEQSLNSFLLSTSTCSPSVNPVTSAFTIYPHSCHFPSNTYIQAPSFLFLDIAS